MLDEGVMSGIRRFLLLALAGAVLAFLAGLLTAPLVFSTPRFVSALGANAQPVAVPSVIGMARQDAQREIESSGLVLAAQWSEYGDLETMGLVVRQDPGPGSQVPRGSPVSIFWNVGPLFRQYHPELLPGLTATEAEEMIADWQLYTAGRSRAPHPTIPEGSVIAVCPMIPESLSVETPVRLLVSTGWQGLPLFQGMETGFADSIAGLHSIVLVYRDGAPRSGSLISGQEPSPGGSFSEGDTVWVTVSGGVAPSPSDSTGEQGEGWGAW
jgi:eukaryotic-like serine/threonine-protein kinase